MGHRLRAGGPLLLLLFAAGLFAPYVVFGEAFLPADPRIAPPWIAGRNDVALAQNLGNTDKLVFTLPNIERIRAAWRGERSLLWNPDILCGHPFLATQDTFALYPLNLLYVLLGAETGFLVSGILHLFLAALFFRLFLRASGLPPAAASVGGIVFGMTGFQIAHAQIPNFMQAIAWTPLILLAVERAFRAPRPADAAILAAGLCLSLLGGMAQITMLACVAALVLAIVRSLENRRRHHRPVASLLTLAGGVVLGMALAAPQILTLFEAARHAHRTDRPVEAVLAETLPPVRILSWIVPDVFGNPADVSRLARTSPEASRGVERLGEQFAPVSPGRNHVESSLAPGIAAWILLLLGFRGGTPQVLPFLVTGLLGLALCLDTPVFRALAAVLPPLRSGNPQRALFLIIIAFAGLAARGAATLLTGGPRRFRTPAVLVAILLLAAATTLAAPGTIASLLGLSGAASDPAATGAARYLGMKILLAAGFGAIALLGILTRRRMGAAPALGLVTLALFLESSHFQQTLNPGQERGRLVPTRTSDFLASAIRAEGGRILRCHDATLPSAARPFPEPAEYIFPPNTPSLFGIPDVQGYEGLLLGRYEDIVGALDPAMLDPTHHLIRPLSRSDRLGHPLVALFGARFIVSNMLLPGIPPVHQDLAERLAVFANASALPRALGLPRVRLFATDADLLRVLAAGTFDPRREALAVLADARPVLSFVPADPPPPEGRAVPIADLALAPPRIVSDSDTEVIVATGWPTPGLLHLADTFHPGWEALADGVSLPILRANHAFRGVLVPAGTRNVRFVFRSPTFRAGLGAAGAALLALVALLLLPRQRKVPGLRQPNL